MLTVTTYLERVVGWIEIVVAAILAVLILVSVAAVALETLTFSLSFPPTITKFTHLIEAVLTVFVVIELFRITVSYARREAVVPTVLETALVVAARQVVVVEGGGEQPLAALGVAAVLLAVAAAWFLLSRVAVAGPQQRA